jgi:hypothetical protein
MVLRLGVAAIVVAVTVSAFAADAQKPKKVKKGRTKQVATQPLPPVPSGPLQQMPLDSVPAVAPQVSYQDGNLTILAHNSNLTDILKAVQVSTGATIDVPPSASERVVTNLGPGPARDILAKLLNGSHYNYVMLGSVSDPNAVSKIVLTSKVTAGADGPSAQSAALQPPQPQVYQNIPQQNQVMPPPNPQPAAEGDGEEVEPEPEAEEGNDPAEQQDQDGAVEPAAGQQPALPAQQGAKTPEQLLQELQRQQQLLQQQQQQQQQQQGQPGQPPQPDMPNHPPQD